MPLRETTFINRNLATWQSLERELAADRPDPDALRDLYAAVSDDLSYARTHYPNRSVKTFLNAKAASLSLSLQRNQRRGIAVQKFFTETVPLELHTQRRALLTALVVFLGAFLVGWFSSVADPDFAASILSDGYVDMTEENIASGDPMGVYKDGSMLGGALGITGNNLRVALLCFVAGIVYGAGTLFVMIYNGVMVGTFQQFFFARGVGWESVLGIWTHGTIEISCIIVAGGAGLVLARGLIWPGTLTRSRSFQLSALSGLRIMAGIAPLIVLAGFIEGFLTRLTDLPTVLRAGFLLLNLAFVVYYFVVRPRQVGARVARPEDDYGRLPPDRPLDWRVDDQPGAGEIFFDGYRFFGARGARLLLAAAGLGFGIVALVLALVAARASLPLETVNSFAYYGGLSDLVAGVDALTAAVCSAALILGLAALTQAIHRYLPKPGDRPTADATPEPRSSAQSRERAATYIGLCVPWTALVVAAYLQPWLALLVLPPLAVWMRGITFYDGSVLRGLTDAFTFTVGSFTSLMALYFLLVVNFAAVLLLYTMLVRSYAVDFVALNFPATLAGVGVADYLSLGFDAGLYASFVAFAVLAFGRYFGSAREYRLATGLERRLKALFA